MTLEKEQKTLCWGRPFLFTGAATQQKKKGATEQLRDFLAAGLGDLDIPFLLIFSELHPGHGAEAPVERRLDAALDLQSGGVSRHLVEAILGCCDDPAKSGQLVRCLVENAMISQEG